MKKLLKYFLFLIICSLSYAGDFIDYELFTQGKEDYYLGNYKKAQEKFDKLLQLFPKSSVFNRNYAYFFIGMNYYKMANYKKACFYLEKATYVPKDFWDKEINPLDKILFFSERDYALGNSFININEIDKGITYLKRLDYTDYMPNSANNEAMALMTLSKVSKTYMDKFDLKFNFDFSKIKEFSGKQLIEIGKFYTNEKNYKMALKFYEYIIDNGIRIGHYKEDVYNNYFKILLELNRYDEILKITKNPPKRYEEIFKFYRGQAFYEKKEFSRALYTFQNIKDEKFYEKSLYYMASIYYILKDYNLTIKYANLIDKKDMMTQSILGYSYLYIGDKKKFNELAQNYIKEYKDTYLALYFKMILDDEFNFMDMDNMKNLGKFADKIIDESKSLPENFIKKADILEMKELNEIGKFGDKELLKINFDKGNFIKISDLSSSFIITNILEKSKFYSLAYSNSKQNLLKFMEYRDLINYEFPLYYKDDVLEISKKYEIKKELIYVILHDLSKFDMYYISEGQRFGLMGIKYKKGDSFQKIFMPKSNIEIGVKILKEYIDEYNGNEIKAMIRYIYGKDIAENLKFYDKNINFDSIIIPSIRYEIKNTILTYIFYTKLY